MSSSDAPSSRLSGISRVNARVYAWLAPTAGVLALIGTTLVGVSGWFAVVGFVLAAIAALSQALQSRWQDRQAELRLRAREAEALDAYNAAVDSHTVLVDQLDPIARTIADMPEQDVTAKQATFGRVTTQAVNAIMLAIPEVRGLRAVVYEVAHDGKSMQVVDWTARTHRAAPTPFVLGAARGDAAFALLQRGEALFVDDIAAAPKDWAGSGNGYNTFISCPISSTRASYGLLTVDAQNTDDLTEEDVKDIRLLAGLLANAFAERSWIH